MDVQGIRHQIRVFGTTLERPELALLKPIKADPSPLLDRSVLKVYKILSSASQSTYDNVALIRAWRPSFTCFGVRLKSFRPLLGRPSLMLVAPFFRIPLSDFRGPLLLGKGGHYLLNCQRSWDSQPRQQHFQERW